MYINTQLDEDSYKKLEYLIKETHANVSDVIKQAIDHYFEKTNKSKITTANERLLSSSFVGCGEAEATLSENYKSELLNILEKKYDNS